MDLGRGLRIYIIIKFLEEADAAGPGEITEPGVHLSIGNFAFCICCRARVSARKDSILSEIKDNKRLFRECPHC